MSGICSAHQHDEPRCSYCKALPEAISFIANRLEEDVNSTTTQSFEHQAGIMIKAQEDFLVELRKNIHGNKA